MDFKVTGTADGITACQMDIKIKGLSYEILIEALNQAKDGRIHILEKLTDTIKVPNGDVKAHAPKMITRRIPGDYIGALIGPGGKHIRAITETSGAQIDIEEDGTVNVYAVDAESMDSAVSQVNALTAEIEIGKVYDGKVITVKDFGAFVECMPGKEGLVHISELAHERVESVESICKPGDSMKVKCIDIDNQGRVRLSRKAALSD